MRLVRIYLLRALLVVMAVQMLNLSVYGRDFVSYSQKNTIGETNQIDSLLEYITEIILHHKDAFPENGTHNHPTRNSHQLKHNSINLNVLISVRKNPEINRNCDITTVHIPSREDYKYLFEREVIPPPPKA